MVYERFRTGAPVENPGVEPVEYLWRPRGSYFYLVREIALAESSRETRKIYPRYFALSPAYPAFLLPFHPSPRYIRSFLFSESVVLCRALLAACGRPPSRSVCRSPRAPNRREKKTKTRVFHRARKSLLSSRRGSIEVFERRQRDMLMPVGAMKFWASEIPDFNKDDRKATMCMASFRFFCLPS